MIWVIKFLKTSVNKAPNLSTLSLDSLICCSITIRKYWVLQPLQKSHFLGERIKSKWLYNRLYISFARVLNKLGRILSVFHFLCYFLLFCFLQVQCLVSSVFKAIIWISNHIVSKNNSIYLNYLSRNICICHILHLSKVLGSLKTSL